MTILVTGAAGFIGFHLSKRLIMNGLTVVGCDNINSYYDQQLKRDRLEQLKLASKNSTDSFRFFEGNLQDQGFLDAVFQECKPQKVVNLAAQAGVRYSIENPHAYIQSNVVGFLNILENCRNYRVKHLIYASSSSVYGGNTQLPFSEHQNVDHPVSIYAATKKSNELMAHSYSHLYGLPTTGLRFFTVYGPWGRPDMALFLFTKNIIEGKPITAFNYGKMNRDFTYIDDIVESIYRILDKPAKPSNDFDSFIPNPSISWCPYKIFNIGNSNPIPLMDYIKAIETNLGEKAIIEYLPLQPGDVPSTSSDTSALESWINYKPKTSIEEGISEFITWYKSYYKI